MDGAMSWPPIAVSIRSPHRSKGRRRSSRGSCPNTWSRSSFNPLPSPKQGETGDSSDGYINRTDPRRFNPLPSPKQGETGLLARADRLLPWPQQVSIRSPHRSKGRHGRGVQLLLNVDEPLRVSIRSPHRSKGRPRGVQAFSRPSRMILFQSAPLTEARGD